MMSALLKTFVIRGRFLGDKQRKFTKPRYAIRMRKKLTKEEQRLEASRKRKAHWKRWGPYLSERQWGTVREDYSADGHAWKFFPHDHARSRTYRWGEDGLAGVCDRHQLICFGLALWNEQDAILKERLFGLANHQGNHGEDVKEMYFYLDSTPTHSYMKYLYKYPQRPFPYGQLIEENEKRGADEPEFELLDTGVFHEDRYFDVFVEYAKATHEDMLIKVTVHNRGPDAASLYVLPTVWFRNTWSWRTNAAKPSLDVDESIEGGQAIRIHHEAYGRRWFICEGEPELVFTENETNTERLWGVPNASPYVKDAFHDYLIEHRHDRVNPHRRGTKAAAIYRVSVLPAGHAVIRLRLTDEAVSGSSFDQTYEHVLARRKAEADEFYDKHARPSWSEDAKNIQRQAFAGLLWSKQYYYYDVSTWLAGDEVGPAPPAERRSGRNADWRHLYNADVVSMPDKWEYPWYATWDLAFHCMSLALVDPDFAKDQLLLFLREWYLHPNGQLPAYEWDFHDVNPPVHAWATWRVYNIDRRLRGQADHRFLEQVFHKLLLNFTWWVNRKDVDGKNVFQGGFLGLDNIGVFDRSKTLPTGGRLDQSDATSWMGMFCLNMLAIALELASTNPAYEGVASKFFEHFVYINHAINGRGDDCLDLWDEQDGFYYDMLHMPDGRHQLLKIRSLVGLIPLFAVETLEPEILEKLPNFRRRMMWFLENRPEFRANVGSLMRPDGELRRLLSIVNFERLPRILHRLFDEKEFLSPYGVRSMSCCHRTRPYVFPVDGQEYRVEYEPGESRSSLFGGNSNWRGPIWFPVNFLLIEALQKFHHFYDDAARVECPSGSEQFLNLWECAGELAKRLMALYRRDTMGKRPALAAQPLFQYDPHWRECLLFYEYFHGDTGHGLGASHQTGWTALIAKLLDQYGEGN